MTARRYLVVLVSLIAMASLPSALEEARHTRWRREAARMLDALQLGAEAHALRTHRLPPSAGPTPPIGSCCWRDDATCAKDLAQWRGAWPAWDFAINDAHRFWYETTTSPDGTRSVLTAVADLGCRGQWTRVSRTLMLLPDGRVISAP